MTRKTIDKTHKCWICGKNFMIKVRISDKKIMSKCFHGRLRKHLFLGWTYQLYLGDKTRDAFKIKKVCYKNTFYKIIGYTKIQRDIVYWIWCLFRGWQKHDYWECKECCVK